jgi:type III secretory pathway component EscV
VSFKEEKKKKKKKKKEEEEEEEEKEDEEEGKKVEEKEKEEKEEEEEKNKKTYPLILKIMKYTEILAQKLQVFQTINFGLLARSSSDTGICYQ